MPPLKVRGAGRKKLRPITAAVGLGAGVYWAMCAFIIAVDPYDLWPWGARVAAGYPGQADAPFIVRAAAKDPTVDLLAIGGSQTVKYSRPVLAEVFGARNPVNLSYSGPSPKDGAEIFEEVRVNARGRRYVVWLDHIYALPVQDRSKVFPAYLYDDDTRNDLGMISYKSVRAAWSALRTGQPFPSRGPGLEDAGELRARARFQTAWSMAALQRQIDERRATVDRPNHMRCDELTTLQNLFAPGVEALLRDGGRVDIIVPAYSPAFYYRARPSPRGDGAWEGIPFSDLMLMRRCLVETLGRTPNVAIFALDMNPAEVADLAQFSDTGHLYGPAWYEALNRVRNPAYRLTPDNVDAYLERLRTSVVAYDVINSNVGRPERGA